MDSRPSVGDAMGMVHSFSRADTSTQIKMSPIRAADPRHEQREGLVKRSLAGRIGL